MVINTWHTLSLYITTGLEVMAFAELCIILELSEDEKFFT